MNIDNLIEMYKIFAPSGNEHELLDYIQDKLIEYSVPFKVDRYGQIYNFQNPNNPLLCAHTDAVHNKKPVGVHVTDKGIVKAKNNIGCDDKNGVWIVLKMLKHNPKLQFIFSVEEECGGKIDQLPLDDLEAPYGLIFDRKGSSDIIGVKNNYCCPDLENAISAVGVNHSYKPAVGVFSDCDALSHWLPTVNLSCGYYNAHTDNEYTIIKDLYNAYKFGVAVVQGIPNVPYEKPEPIYYNYKAYYGDWKDYEEWDFECPICNAINCYDDEECFYCGEKLYNQF